MSGEAARAPAPDAPDYPERLFRALAAHGVGAPGERVLDLGAGTGGFGRGLARRGARVVGIEPRAGLLDDARRLDAAEKVSTRYVLARAEALPFADGTFDGVAAGRSWHRFDRPRALAEAARVLAPAGWLAIVHLEWAPTPDGPADATARLVRAYDPAWRADPADGLYPTWIPPILEAGLDDLETFCFDVRVPVARDAWRARVGESVALGGRLRAPERRRLDAELDAILRRRFPAEPLEIAHRVFALIARRPRDI